MGELGEKVPEFFLCVQTGVKLGDAFEQMTIECDDVEELHKHIDEALDQWPNFQCIILVHASDALPLMEGAQMRDES